MTYLYLITSAFFILSTPFTFASESLRNNGSVRFNDHFSEPFKHLLSKKITHAIEQGELTTQEAINERKASLNERYLPYINQTIDSTTLKGLKDICSFNKRSKQFEMFQMLFLAGDFHHDDTFNEEGIREFLDARKNKKTQQHFKKKKAFSETMSQVNKRTWASRTEEEKRAIVEKMSEARKEAWASKSEEEKRAIVEKMSEAKKRKRMGDSITGDRAVPPSKYKKLTEDQTTSDFERILHDKTHLSSDTESE